MRGPFTSRYPGPSLPKTQSAGFAIFFPEKLAERPEESERLLEVWSEEPFPLSSEVIRLSLLWLKSSRVKGMVVRAWKSMKNSLPPGKRRRTAVADMKRIGKKTKREKKREGQQSNR